MLWTTRRAAALAVVGLAVVGLAVVVTTGPGYAWDRGTGCTSPAPSTPDPLAARRST